MEVADRIGKRLKELREERSWTQQMIAERLGVSQPTIAGIEAGTQLPGATLMGKLADLFGVNRDYFYRVKENPFEVLMRAPEAAEELRPVLRLFSEKCLRYRQVEQAAGVPVYIAPEYAPPSKGTLVVSYAERLAEQERQRLDLGSDPLMDLPTVLESQGLRVIGVKTEAKLDGLFLFADEDGAFILVNTSQAKSKERQLFTLAHEYAHVLMHRKQGYNIDPDIFSIPKKGNLVEMTANAFAAAFLMPKSVIMDVWEKGAQYDTAKIILLKRTLSVSYSALGWRLFNLDLITSAQRKELADKEGVLRNQEKLLYGDETQPCLDIRSFSDRQRFYALKAYQSGDVSVNKLAEWLETDIVSADEIAKALSRKEAISVPAAS